MGVEPEEDTRVPTGLVAQMCAMSGIIIEIELSILSSKHILYI